MILQTFMMNTRPGMEDEYKRLFRGWRAQVLAEDVGTLRYDLYRHLSDSTQHLVIQEYTDQAALDFHSRRMIERQAPQQGAHVAAGMPVLTVYRPIIV